MKCYHTIPRMQMHLKRSDDCMRRTCLLLRPLTVPEVHEVEADDKKRAKRLLAGAWQTYDVVAPPVVALGPSLLTKDERIDACGESLDLGTLSRLYQPEPDFHRWIEHSIQSRSSEGPRTGTVSFWSHRPRFTRI